MWAANIVSWAAHVVRKTAGASWSSRILHVRSTAEIDELRATKSYKRPETRMDSGFVCRWWTDSVQVAMDYGRDYNLFLADMS